MEPELRGNRFLPLEDARVAGWVVPASPSQLATLGYLMPDGFECYLALPHPMRAYVNAPIAWSDVAAAAGLEVNRVRRSAVLIAALSDERSIRMRLERQAVDLTRADAGHLPVEVITELVRVLSPSDANLETVFAVWDGWGARTALIEKGAHFEFGSRGWYLLRAPIRAAVTGFGEGPVSFGLGPGMWWPRDRSWIVVTDIDLEISYIGCAASTASALGASNIECYSVGLDSSL